MMDELIKKGLAKLPKRELAHTVLDFVWDAGEKYYADLKVRNEAIAKSNEARLKEREDLRRILVELNNKLR